MVMNFQAMSVLLIISVTIILAATTKLSTAVVQPSPDCKTTCGNLTNINFPFGMSEECYLDENFLITCNTTFQPPKGFYRKGNLPVLSISHEAGEMRVQQPVSRVCYNSSGNRNQNRTMLWEVYSAKFRISYTHNKFTAVGCETAGLISGPNYSTGCIAACNRVENTVNGSCTGVGCCESQIPRGVNNFSINAGFVRNHSRVDRFSPCSYVFLAQEGSYIFNSLDLWNLSRQDQFPIVLDWAVGSVACTDAIQNESSYAC